MTRSFYNSYTAMKFSLVVLVACFGSTIATPIIGGDDVGDIRKFGTNRIIINPGTFPFMVLVKRDGHACSGVIIKRNAVLTAAHCVDTKPRAVMSVWAGILHRQLQIGQGQEVPVKDHSLYRKEQQQGAKVYEDDIAILWLETLLILVKKQVEIARLPSKNFEIEDKDGLTAGWGMKNCGTHPNTLMLQKTTLRTISQEKCQQHFNHLITKKEFCAISENKLSTTSFGDSGSPFVVDGLLVGLSAYGSVIETRYANGHIDRKCDPTKPAVFTKIPFYLEWIEDEIAKHPVKPKSPRPSTKTTRKPKITNVF